MNLDNNDKTLLTLAAVGILIAIGKMLTGGKKVTLPLALGRIAIGAGLSMAAGAALLEFPTLSPVGLVGIGSILGISGLELLERLVQRWMGGVPIGKKKSESEKCFENQGRDTSSDEAKYPF